jgi:hypothetical protein
VHRPESTTTLSKTMLDTFSDIPGGSFPTSRRPGKPQPLVFLVTNYSLPIRVQKPGIFTVKPAPSPENSRGYCAPSHFSGLYLELGTHHSELASRQFPVIAAATHPIAANSRISREKSHFLIPFSRIAFHGNASAHLPPPSPAGSNPPKPLPSHGLFRILATIFCLSLGTRYSSLITICGNAAARRARSVPGRRCCRGRSIAA